MLEITADQIVKEINEKLILFNCKKNTVSGFDREIKNIIMKDQHVLFKLNRLNSEITQQCNTITNVKKNILLHKKTPLEIQNFLSKENQIKKNKIDDLLIDLEFQKLMHITNFEDYKLYIINKIILQNKFKLQELFYFPINRNVFCETTHIFKEQLKQDIIVLQNEIKLKNINKKLISIIDRNNALLIDLQNNIDIDANNNIDLLNYNDYLTVYSSHQFLCDYINKYLQSYMLINKYKIEIQKCRNLSLELNQRILIYTIELENSIINKKDDYIKNATYLLNDAKLKHNLNEGSIISINKLSNYQKYQLENNKNEILIEHDKIKEYYIKKDEIKIKNMTLNTFMTSFLPRKNECSICFENKMLFKTYTCEHYICQKCYISINVKQTYNICPYCRCNKKTEFMCLLFNKFNNKLF
jgi:hypothetical protein